MRIRYYEPGSGRFISQGPGADGQNYYCYCQSNPVNLVDQDGKIAGTSPMDICQEMLQLFLKGLLWQNMLKDPFSGAMARTQVRSIINKITGLCAKANIAGLLCEDAAEDEAAAGQYTGLGSGEAMELANDQEAVGGNYFVAKVVGAAFIRQLEVMLALD